MSKSKVNDCRLEWPWISGLDLANVMIGWPFVVTWHRNSVKRCDGSTGLVCQHEAQSLESDWTRTIP